MQIQRIVVLAETLSVLGDSKRLQRYRKLAAGNLVRWRSESAGRPFERRVEVFAEDWGVVAQRLTESSGECYAVLNMADADFAGGGYVEGYGAQEENMFRRTDCHFSLTEQEMDPATGLYHPEMSRLINGLDGRVYLDTDLPRICVRAPEQRQAGRMGYEWLSSGEVFPFYELRAAAQNCSGGKRFNLTEARRRIEVQLDTLLAKGIRHVVLSAFGCGAFANPASKVSVAYRDAILQRKGMFTHIAFAVLNRHGIYDNYSAFEKTLHGLAF